NADEAQRRASELTTDGAFIAAFPAYEMRVDVTPWDPMPAPAAAGPSLTALRQIRMPAAWNASTLATTHPQRTTVVVPDYYSPTTPHAEIPSQRFVGPSRGDSLVQGGLARGNHGFWTSGIVAANYDRVGPIGTSPAPDTLIELRSIQVAG